MSQTGENDCLEDWKKMRMISKVEKKIEVKLTAREIEVILDLMDLGITFSVTHGDPEFNKPKHSDGNVIPCKQEKIINIDELKKKLREKMILA